MGPLILLVQQEGFTLKKKKGWWVLVLVLVEPILQLEPLVMAMGARDKTHELEHNSQQLILISSSLTQLHSTKLNYLCSVQLSFRRATALCVVKDFILFTLTRCLIIHHTTAHSPHYFYFFLSLYIYIYIYIYAKTINK